uniref:Uncharacterized protein n=1 Tax=Panagrolaimus davidi TaxID=227884 RepID=A0A914PNJ8_9BILA
MLKPQCYHDPKNWVIRTRMRKRVKYDVQSPSVPPKVPPLKNGNNFSQSRKTQESNYQEKAEKSAAYDKSKSNATTLPTSATIKSQTTCATNSNQTTGVQLSTPNVSSKVTSHFNFSSTAATSNIQAVSPKDTSQLNLSTPTAATTINNQKVTPSINSQLNMNTSSSATSKSSRYYRMLSRIGAFSDPVAAAVAGTSTLKQRSKPSNLNDSALKAADENMVPKSDSLPKTPTAKKYHANEDDVIFLIERKSTPAKRPFVAVTKTTSKAKKNPTLAANDLTKPKYIELITLDSDTDDDMNDDAIVAKATNSSLPSSNNTPSSNGIKTETAETSSNLTSTTETSFTEDTFIQILNAAPSFSTSSVQESTVISPMRVHDSDIASNVLEKSAEAFPKSDGTCVNRDDSVILAKSQISSKITPTPTRTNERGDRLLSWITNISNCSMESLDFESDDFSIVEHPRQIATTSPAPATIKNQTIDAQLGTPNVSSKVTSHFNFSSTAATSNIQAVPPKDASQLNLSASTALTTINNKNVTPSVNSQLNLNTSSSSASINNQATGARYRNPKATEKGISQHNSKSSSSSAMIVNQIVPLNGNSQLNLNIPSSSASINNQTSAARYSNSKASAKVTSQLNLVPYSASAEAAVADNQIVPPKVNDVTTSSVDTTINSKNGSPKVKSGLNFTSSSTAVTTFNEFGSKIVAPKRNVTTSLDDTTRSNPNDSSRINRQLNISSAPAAINSQTDDVTNAPPKVTSSACSIDVPTTSNVQDDPAIKQIIDNKRTVINNQTPLPKVTPRLNLALLSTAAAIDTETVLQNVASQLNPTTSSADTIRSNLTASPEIASSLFSNSTSGTSNVQNNSGINHSTVR